MNNWDRKEVVDETNQQHSTGKSSAIGLRREVESNRYIVAISIGKSMR